MADGYVPKPNSGNLFRVPAEKRTKDTWPEFDGEFMVVCPHCQAEARGWLSAWIKTAPKTGKQFFSISLKFREKQPAADRVPDQRPAAPAARRPAYGEDDEKIPF